MGSLGPTGPIFWTAYATFLLALAPSTTTATVLAQAIVKEGIKLVRPRR
jgi:hypothetical protein